MDNACLFKNDKISRDFVAEWVLVANQLVRQGMAAPGMGPFNLVILRHVAVQTGTPYDGNCENNTAFWKRPSVYAVDGFFNCMQREFDTRLRGRTVSDVLDFIYIEPSVPFVISGALPDTSVWPYTLSFDWFSMVLHTRKPGKVFFSDLRVCFRDFLQNLQSASRDCYVSIFDVPMTTIVTSMMTVASRDRCLEYIADIRHLYERGDLFSVHFAGHGVDKGLLLHMPSTLKRAANGVDRMYTHYIGNSTGRPFTCVWT